MMSEELHSQGLCVLYSLTAMGQPHEICPLLPIKLSLQVGWTSDLLGFVPGVPLEFSMVP